MELAAVRIVQNGFPMFMTYLTAQQLVSQKILPDVWSDENETGYQRDPEHAKLRKFGRYLMNKASISPTSILLSVRGKVSFHEETKGSHYGKLTIPDDVILYVVDGQHRVEGIKWAMDHAENFDSSFTIPAIIISPTLLGEAAGADAPYTEAKQFVIINRTQKRVKADLHDRFIARLTPEKRLELEVLGSPEQLERTKIATDVVDRLRKMKESVWFNNIKVGAHTQGIVSQVTFKRPLEKSLEKSPLKDLSDDELADALDAYWGAWAELCPAAFESPDDYVLQKSTGVSVLNRLFPDVVQWLQNTNKELTKDHFLSVLRIMDFGTTDAFWYSQTGEAGKVFGEKLFKELYEKFANTFLAQNVKALQEKGSS